MIKSWNSRIRLWFLLLSFFGRVPYAALQDAEERNLLAAVRSGIDNWTDFKASNNIVGWDNSSTCAWTGIVCNSQGLVAAIDLPCNGCPKQAIGRLAPELGNFTALEKVDFSNQFFTGPLPEAWSEMNAMQQLLNLNLSTNHLTGTLPSWADHGAFPVLRQMQVDHNQLYGPLPPTWGDGMIFPQMRLLDLSSNLLTGELPVEWGLNGAWAELLALNLQSNNLTGTIPDEWVEDDGFISLEMLRLGHNSLEGSVPLGFGEPPASLTFLDLSYNLFDGALPSNWSESGLSNLTSLYLNNCNFSGSLPDAWGSQISFQSLQMLDVHSNSISGGLPATWASQGAFPYLKTLNLANNWFVGSLTEAWGRPNALPSLQNLTAPFNAFSGQLPAAWGQPGSFPALQNLDLSANYLTGSLPTSWGTPGAFSKLANFSVFWNRLSGSIPASWSTISSLRQFWVQPGNLQLCGGWPGTNLTVLCKNLGAGCIRLANLSNTCSFSPGTSALYLPPSPSLNYLQATLRLRQGSAISDDGLIPTLADAVNYVMTSAQAATIVSLTRTSSQATLFAMPGVSSRRLLQVPQNRDSVQPGLDQPPFPSLPDRFALMDFQHLSSSGDSQLEEATRWSIPSGNARRLLEAQRSPAPAPVLGVDYNTLDAVVQLLASNGSDAYKMEEQIMTIIGSNGLLNVLAGYRIQLDSIQLLAVEPASVNNVPGYWNALIHDNPGNLLSAEPPSSSLAPTAGVFRARYDASSEEKHERTDVIVPAVLGSVLAAACLTMLALWYLKKRRIRALGQSGGKADEMLPPSENLEDSMHSQYDSDGSRGGLPLEATLSGEMTRLKSNPPALAVLQRRKSNADDHVATLAIPSGFSLPAMPWSDWEISSSEIQICKRRNGALWELGSGSFGKVFKAMRSSSQPVAVKILHEDQQCPEFGQEIAILKACRHSNIVAFQGVCTQEGRVMLVTEFMEGGDLFRALSSPSARKLLQWDCCGKNIALDVARGLHFLHNHQVIHFDLKSQNILLSREGTAKITDVGLARITKDGYVSRVDSVVGTFAWAAPELLLGNRCSEKIDIYSFGVLLWELAVTSHTGERPQRGQLRDVIVPEELPEGIEKLRQDCMEVDPKLRPTAKNLYEQIASIS